MELMVANPETNLLGFTPEQLLDLAAEKVADQYLDREGVTWRVEQVLEARVKDAVGKGLNEKIDALLTAEMEKILGEEIVPMNIWGERQGSPTTIRNQIAERARTFWEERVNKDGKLETYGGQPRHEHLIRKIVNEEFSAAIKQNVVAVVSAMKIAAKAHAEQITNEALDNLIKVKVPA
jgi:hypothetical protein